MYLNIIQLSESFGVEESVIEGWVSHEGLPHVPDRGRLLFDRAQVAAWAALHGRASKVGFLAPEAPPLHGVRRLEPLLRTGGIWRNLASSEVPGVLEQVVCRLSGATPVVRQLLIQRLHTPGGLTMAGVGGGFALPHLRSPVSLGPDAGTFALLLLREPMPLTEEIPDAVPVTRLLFFVAPSPRAHMEILAQLSIALTRGNLRGLILKNASDAEIFAGLDSSEANETVAPDKEGKK